MTFRFEILHQSSRSNARVGRIHTPHGTIDTPSFVAVGTNGTLKGLDNTVVDSLGLELMFCNTYHLLLQPGRDVVREAGGLHTFIGRKHPIITDSGGFQVFSLAYGGVANELKSRGLKKQDGTVLKVSEDGVVFRSYRNGEAVTLTPESSVDAQKDFGADIIIPLDELTPFHLDRRAFLASFARTHRWEARSLARHRDNPNGQAMYSVIHGGTDPELRKQSAEQLAQMPFDGHAIGGSLGKDRDQMLETVAHTLPFLPPEKPNHLLGIADLYSVDRFIPLGIDTFDSAYPTRSARHGVLFTDKGPIRLKSRRHQFDQSPPEDDCPCPLCQHHSIGYLHHLYKAHEATAATLASYHNVAYMVKYLRRLRQAILDDRI